MLNITDHQANEIKITMRYRLTPVRMVKIKNTRNESVSQDMEKKEPSCTAGENESGVATLENSMEVSQKAKNRTAL